jgi:hypothetical protein
MKMSSLIDRVVALLAEDPFIYLVVTILGLIVWASGGVMGGAVLAGRGLWVRRVALLVAAASTVLFAYSARSLK